MENREQDWQAIEAEVQKTLQSLDRVEKVNAKSFFFTRLQHRLDALQALRHEHKISATFTTFLRPVLAPLLIVASIGAGILIGYKQTASPRSSAAEALVETYGLQAPDLAQYTLMSNE